MAHRQPQRRHLVARRCPLVAGRWSCSVAVLSRADAATCDCSSSATTRPRPRRARRAHAALVAIVAAVGLIAFATAAAGPIAFVAFLAGPIAARIVGPGASLARPGRRSSARCSCSSPTSSAQYAVRHPLPGRRVTGALGAPYLVFLLVRTNRSGGSL